MGSQDNTNRKTYNDPNSEVDQYSLQYMRSLRAAGQNDEISRLYELGHFNEAIAEEGASKAANRAYSRNKGISQAGSVKELEEKQERDALSTNAAREAKKQEVLAQLRRLGVNPDDLR